MLLMQTDPAMLGRREESRRTTAWRGCEASCWGGGWHAEVIGAALLAIECMCVQLNGSVVCAAAGSSLAHRRLPPHLVKRPVRAPSLAVELVADLVGPGHKLAHHCINLSLHLGLASYTQQQSAQPSLVSTTTTSPCAAAAHVYLMLERCCIRYVSA